jgi:hypothetical protein
LTAAEVLRERSCEYELNALALDERVRADDDDQRVAIQCFYTVALALREVADVLTEQEA